MADVRRIYPESKTALINWIEQNFHEIDSYVAAFRTTDGKVFIIHDVHSEVEALGMLESTKFIMAMSAHEGTLVVRNKGD